MKKTIDFSLEKMLKDDELGTVAMLREVITQVILCFDDITDTTVKQYNSKPDSEYEIKISVSTIRKYLKNYGYAVRKDKSECIIKEMCFPEYVKIRKEIDKDKNHKTNTQNDSKRSLSEILAINFVTKAANYKSQKMMSIRCATIEQERLEKLYSAYPMFTKQFLLSFVLSVGMDSIGFFLDVNQHKNLSN